MDKKPMPEGYQVDEDLGRRNTKPLWSIEVFYSPIETNETASHSLMNRTTPEMMKFRETIFACGLMLPVDPGHWIIIPPAQVREIHVYKQQKFFEP